MLYNTKMENKKTFEDLLMEYPLKVYVELHSRLQLHGMNASFPEFKPVVDHLLKELDNPKFVSIIKSHPMLSYEVKEVRTMLAHVNLVFTFDDKDSYPYPEPFTAPFPYRPTIDAIEAGVRLFDKLNRLEPGNKAVPLYHFDRYAYHKHSLITDPDMVILPTIRDLTFTDLIRTRSVPIGLIGVFTETVRVDRHQQSPLDFWYHDINHVRRMLGYMKLREKKLNIQTEMQKLLYYKEMDDFLVEKIMPNIIKLPQASPKEEIALRRMFRVIIFEILHESALTAEPETIIEDMLRPAGPQPFEHMLAFETENKETNIENLRTPTGNVKSGISLFTDNKENRPVMIRYFFDRALSLLSNVNNKLNFGFYDDPDSPNELVVPVDYRKPKYIVQASKKIFEVLGFTDIPSDEELLDLAESREGSKEKFVYKGVRSDAMDMMGNNQSATDPISAQEIITEIKSFNKVIYTLFGYSKLGYQDLSTVLEQIRAELSGLDPKTTIINIGTTQEGIGEAYKVAKELNFETIGIVSTQALFYSGKFSDYVDKIYIVNDMNWGGYMGNTKELTPTTKAFLEVSNTISAYGGGEHTAIVLKEAKERGINVKFTPAQMNHEFAKNEAKAKGQTIKDFTGSANKMWEKIK